MRLLLMLLLFGPLFLGEAWAEPAPLQLESPVPVEIHGVSPAMAAPARQVVERQLAQSGDRTASAPLADDLAFFLARRYLQAGYSEAEATWALAGGRIRLDVTEGRQWNVGAITLTGVEPAVAQDLTPFLTRQTRERAGRRARQLPFVAADLEAGRALVVRRLQANGYLQASADPPILTRQSKSGHVDISMALVQGPRSVFGPVTLTGEAALLSAPARAKAAALTGQPYNEVVLETLRTSLVGDLQHRGHFAAQVVVVPHPVPETAPVPATLEVLPGQVFEVTEVRVAPTLGKGATRVADAVFRPAQGDRYNPEMLDLLHRRTIDTGIFRRLETEFVSLSDRTLALSVTGEETPPITAGLFGGYATFLGPILGVEARHLNFMDTGNALGMRAEWRGTGAEGSLLFTDPAIFGSRQALSLGASAESFSFRDYVRHTAALRATLTRRITRRITAEIFAAVTANDVTSDLLSPDELGPDSYRTLSAGGNLMLDYRDHPLNPHRGWMTGIRVESGFDNGNDAAVSFVRTDLQASWYHPLNERWRIALGARASALASNGTVEDLPIDLRLFNGGATTVRSFAERELGPFSRRGDTPLGGRATTAFNAELSRQIIPNFEIAAFADAGTLSREHDSLFNVGNLRYATGLGLRYQLPIGPLRLDYGYNPNRQPGDAIGAFHLTFGFAF